MSLRIAHLSDLHYCAKHLAQVDACMAHAVERVRASLPDVVVVSGDSTDHALNAHEPAFAALVQRIQQLAQCAPVLLLQGTFSHEPPGLLRAVQLASGRYPVHVADRLCQIAWHPAKGFIESAGWRFAELPTYTACLFSCMPTVNKASVAAAVGAEAAPERMGEVVHDLLAGFATINRLARERGIATVGIGHGTVSGCLTEHDVPMAGFDHEFGLGSLAACGAAAFLLGHIHRQQSWSLAGTTIAYAGSIARLHFGEEGDKGWLLWTVAGESASFRVEPTPARATRDLVFDGLPDLAVIEAAAAAVEGVAVRVRYTVPEEETARVDRQRIEQLLGGALELKIEGRVIPVLRARAAGISQAQTLEEKLARYAALTRVQPEGLAERLQLLLAHCPDDIVRRLLAARAAESANDGADAARTVPETEVAQEPVVPIATDTLEIPRAPATL